MERNREFYCGMEITPKDSKNESSILKQDTLPILTKVNLPVDNLLKDTGLESFYQFVSCTHAPSLTNFDTYKCIYKVKSTGKITKFYTSDACDTADFVDRSSIFAKYNLIRINLKRLKKEPDNERIVCQLQHQKKNFFQKAKEDGIPDEIASRALDLLKESIEQE